MNGHRGPRHRTPRGDRDERPHGAYESVNPYQIHDRNQDRDQSLGRRGEYAYRESSRGHARESFPERRLRRAVAHTEMRRSRPVTVRPIEGKRHHTNDNSRRNRRIDEARVHDLNMKVLDALTEMFDDCQMSTAGMRRDVDKWPWHTEMVIRLRTLGTRHPFLNQLYQDLGAIRQSDAFKRDENGQLSQGEGEADEYDRDDD